MSQGPTRIVLDVHPGPPIHGQLRFEPMRALPQRPGEEGVGAPAGMVPVNVGPQTFSGWIGLLTALQAALSDQADT